MLVGTTIHRAQAATPGFLVAYWSPGDEVTLDLLPGRDVLALFESAMRSNALLSNVLTEWLPRPLAHAFCEALVGGKPMKQYRPAELALLAERLHGWTVKPSGSEGCRKAEVTRSGIDPHALQSKTILVRNVPGLFFIGEGVDVTGWLGGYHFQWARSSGWVAGQTA
jgi:hypothetical protein